MDEKNTDFTIGEDLYGISVDELETRLIVLKSEISRLEVELAKKKQELSAANQIFGKK